ncbi:MAG: glycolate oxidase subunit GlcF [Albidovulum sp.]|nr:glycolate oxidase subunit GlcF [Albidovulum sp.]
MQTNFTDRQLENPDFRRSNDILRACVHCGFCTATCPTYQILGDELDSPRGRIYLIKDMLENERPADKKTVLHIDRCLSCLACMTTCPSGVHYMHLVDHAREYIEKTYRRPPGERLLRGLLAAVLPRPTLFRLALLGAKLAAPLSGLVPSERLRAMLALAPKDIPPVSRYDDPQVFAANGERKMRVCLMTGCAQRALNTNINDATIRLLRRLGCEVVVAKGAGCCGALAHHMGKSKSSRRSASRNVAAWKREHESCGIDAVAINASGCGTTIKDYGHMLRDTPQADDAAMVAGMARDITEILPGLEFPKLPKRNMRIAYHAACSLQHGQKIKSQPKELLEKAGFEIVEPADSHLCCGSAGTYNLMQPAISAELQSRKVHELENCRPDAIAAGNIGCMIQIASGTRIPVVHTVELLDWATGGPKPETLGSAG